jgi:hypothetical protein
LNGKERKKNEKRITKAKAKAKASQVSVKLTKEQAHQRMLGRIRRENGLSLAVADKTRDETPTTSLLGEWEDWSAQTLQSGFQLVKNAVQWMPGRSLLAEAAKVCDVEGNCKADPRAEAPPVTIADFKKHASAHGFSMTRSPSLKAREDQTLRDVAVLIADNDHGNPSVQANLESLLRESVLSGDSLLVEAPSTDGAEAVWMKEACWNVQASGVRCYGIDTSEARAELDEAQQKYSRALGRLCQAVIGKTVLWRGPHPSLQQLVDMGYLELQKIVQTHNAKMFYEDGASKFSPQEAKSAEELGKKAMDWDRKFNAILTGTVQRREEAMYREIEHHAAQADGPTTWVVLGSAHVANLKTPLLETRDVIVLTPKRE